MEGKGRTNLHSLVSEVGIGVRSCCGYEDVLPLKARTKGGKR